MKVEAVEAYPVRVKIEGNLSGGTFAYADYQAALVKATCDGVEGWGEAMSRSDPRVNSMLVEYLSKELVGKEFPDVASAWRGVWGRLRVRGHTRGPPVEALSGIEIALEDCAGKIARRPLSALFGVAEGEVPALAGSLFESRGSLADQVEVAKSKGLSGAKVKVGFGLERDLRILQEVRRAWPEGVLIADANGAYDSTSAPLVCRSFSGLGLAWFEEPVLSDDLAGYESVRSLGVRIGAGESWFVSDFDGPIEDALVGVFEPSVSRCGGVGVEVGVASRAKSRGLGFSPMTGMNSGLSLAASLQVAALHGTEGVEFNPFDNPLQTELVTGLDEPRGGRVKVPQRPGLGVEVDEAFVKRHLVGA